MTYWVAQILDVDKGTGKPIPTKRSITKEKIGSAKKSRTVKRSSTGKNSSHKIHWVRYGPETGNKDFYLQLINLPYICPSYDPIY